MGVYLCDRLGNMELLYRDPDISSLTPLPVRPRPRPTSVADLAEWGGPLEGRLLLQDVYRGLDGLPRGTVKSLRPSSGPLQSRAGGRASPAQGRMGRHVHAAVGKERQRAEPSWPLGGMPATWIRAPSTRPRRLRGVVDRKKTRAPARRHRGPNGRLLELDFAGKLGDPQPIYGLSTRASRTL